jgi:hypothetical protein
MVVLFAGIRSLLRKAEEADLSRPAEAPDPGEIIPEWWATSSRNGGRDHLGIGGRHHSGTTGDFTRNRHGSLNGFSWVHEGTIEQFVIRRDADKKIMRKGLRTKQDVLHVITAELCSSSPVAPIVGRG